ncbi:MAG TPA: glycosyltransferase family 2 protein [Candidatus Dojkabacteria bacterium]|nr:glycosyltransferase family 2 protein [Candidatus Dojkabacteria bacterium]
MQKSLTSKDSFKINRPLLTIIMPVFNEAQTVEQAIRRLSALPVSKELIVIDDYCTDGSRELLKKLYQEFKFKLILHAQNMGKGYGVRQAAAYAKGKYMIVEDADLELDIGVIAKMMEIIENEPSIDMVNGNRILKKGGKSGILQNLARVITSVLAKILYGKYLNDLLCSYKLCLVSKFKQLNLKSTRFGLETEWIIKAFKKGWKIVETDVLFMPRLHKQGKKIQFFDGFDIIWQLIKYRFTN